MINLLTLDDCYLLKFLNTNSFTYFTSRQFKKSDYKGEDLDDAILLKIFNGYTIKEMVNRYRNAHNIDKLIYKRGEIYMLNHVNNRYFTDHMEFYDLSN